MIKKILLYVILFFGVFSFVSASESSGTIDPQNQGFNKAYLVNNGGITTMSREINVGKFSVQSNQNMIITDHEISGWMWGAGTGWISFSCLNTNSCSSSNYKVYIDNEGYVTGYAWGPQAGWVNFAPMAAGNKTVRIMPNGEFVGYAWSQVFGYISFNCSNDDSCNTTNFKTYTDFRPINYRSRNGFVLQEDNTNKSQVSSTLDITRNNNTVESDKPIKPVKPISDPKKLVNQSNQSNISKQPTISKNIEQPSELPNIVKFVPTTQPPEITKPNNYSELNKNIENQEKTTISLKETLKNKSGIIIITLLLLLLLITRIFRQ